MGDIGATHSRQVRRLNGGDVCMYLVPPRLSEYEQRTVTSTDNPSSVVSSDQATTKGW
jgi:hypothetical protein